MAWHGIIFVFPARKKSYPLGALMGNQRHVTPYAMLAHASSSERLDSHTAEGLVHSRSWQLHNSHRAQLDQR